MCIFLLQVSWLRPAFDSFPAFVRPAVSIVHGPQYLFSRSTQHVLQLIHKFQALSSSCAFSSNLSTYYNMFKFLFPHDVPKKLQLSIHQFFRSSLFYPVCCDISSFVFRVTYDILCILRKHHISNALIAFLSSAFKVQVLQPYCKTGCTLHFRTRILVRIDIFLFFRILSSSTKARLACAIRHFTSVTHLPSVLCLIQDI